jgi:exosortase A
MTGQAIAPSIGGQLRQSFRLAGPVLGLGLLLLGLLFHTEVAAAVGVWTESTAYNHCFLILPIVAYLLWERRELLAASTPAPNAWFALAAIPVSVAWLLAERLGIMEGRQLMAMTLVEICFLSVLGWRLFFRLAGPLLYLYFLVPFGAFLTPWLQGFTTSFVVHGLNILNIPNYSDGYAIEIPEGSFLVAEACAGLRFLIASIAFGYLYAMLMYRSPVRRGLFMLASIVVPIIANGFRALGIVVLGHIIGNAQAAVADHIIYGWIFFSVVILLLIALGLPFRQDQRPRAGSLAGAPSRGRHVGPPMGALAAMRDSRRPRPGAARESSIRPAEHGRRGLRRRSLPLHERALDEVSRYWSRLVDQATRAPSRSATPGRFAVATAVVVVIAAIGPAAAALLNQGAAADLPATLQPIAFTGACINDPDRTPPSAIVAELRVLSGEPGAQVSDTVYLPTLEGPRSWRVLEFHDPAGAIATSLWIDGHATQVTFDMRVRRAWASVVGSSYAPVAISLTPDLDWSRPSVALRNRARDLIALFVQTYQSMPDQVARISYAAAH